MKTFFNRHSRALKVFLRIVLCFSLCIFLQSYAEAQFAHDAKRNEDYEVGQQNFCAAPPCAFFFNMTGERISSISIGGIEIPGLTVQPMTMSNPWTVSLSVGYSVAALYGTNIKVVFANGCSWTQTVDARPSVGSAAVSVAVWLLANGLILSSEKGALKQAAWADCAQ
ncbi:hypothetical protein [Azospirillum sp. B2RO_4]|uniref:hypothetical protein n=1 Tax=Azospirillum sp. B2RO_4 TaxID=3027796 RepID=UPI003DA7DB63